MEVDIPAFDWPIAKFPRYKYPLADHKEYNAQQDKECLKDVEEKIGEWKKKDNDVAAVIVEPIQAEGGDHYGSPAFFQVCLYFCLTKTFFRDSVILQRRTE